jgi:hypothetical protein
MTMSVLGDVLDSLRAMTQLQLLLAFVACIGYAFAQGDLFGAVGRRRAWCMTALATVGFGIESTNWAYATMLVAFAVAGLGLFVASTWLISRALGLARPLLVENDTTEDALATAATPLGGPRPMPPRSAPVHSH